MENKNNFLDSRTILAVVLVGIMWFGWQKYLETKYPNINKAKVADNNESTESKDVTKLEQNNQPSALSGHADKATNSTDNVPVSASQNISEALISYDSEYFKFDISSVGMGIKNIVLKKYKDREKNEVRLGKSEQAGLFETKAVGVGNVAIFEVRKISDTEFEGRSVIDGTTIIKTLTINAEKYLISQKVVVRNPSQQFRGLDILLNEQAIKTSGGSLLAPSFDHQDFIINSSGKTERQSISNSKENLNKDYSVVSMVSISSQYFATAILDKSNINPQLKVQHQLGDKEAKATLSYRPTELQDGFEVNLLAFAGPKSLGVLQSIDTELATIIDYGFFGSIAKIMLPVMKWFYSFFGNWGVAIILLTLLVRFLVLPFNIMSMRSMKAMQKVQPLIKSLQERYKNDPQALQREMLSIYKEHKVNPFGSCLPMLLQLPVFLALYQVLGQSIELYQAPFFGWIHDLSVKDPYYVIPVLMGIAMFMQQKLTPTTTMDPTQAKIMQFMPIIFALMMVSFPSGLTLYIFVSTLFGIFQQVAFLKDTKA